MLGREAIQDRSEPWRRGQLSVMTRTRLLAVPRMAETGDPGGTVIGPRPGSGSERCQEQRLREGSREQVVCRRLKEAGVRRGYGA